jgi:hypothetical protein
MVDHLRFRPYRAACTRESLRPFAGIAGDRTFGRAIEFEAAPDLAAGLNVVVNQADIQPRFRCNSRGRHPSRAGADNRKVEVISHSETTSIAGAQKS